MVPKIADGPFSEPMNHWLKNTEAAEALAVGVRTVKRWMTCPETRDALGAVRNGKQWRIPRPDNLPNWGYETRRQLKSLGISLKPKSHRDLGKLGKETGRYWLESCRLWLAAWIKVLESGSITQQAREQIGLLKATAGKVLVSSGGEQVDKLRCKVSEQLQARGLSKTEVLAVMSYWPEKKHFDGVPAASTPKKLEQVRKNVDYAQAVRELEQSGQNPTAELVRPLLHKDMLAHVNDTRESLPGIVIKNPSREQTRSIALASVYAQIQGKPSPPVTLDFRQPQTGLPLRTMRRRHPSRQSPQREIVAAVCDARESIPGADERPVSGKTPVRDSAYPRSEHSGRE